MTSSKEGTPARAIVCGHGAFADGMVSAVEQITGRGDSFLALSNKDLCGSDLEDYLKKEILRTGASAIFTDLPAGSATVAARRIAVEMPGLVVITGANLAMLLDFMFHAESSPSEAARHAVEKAKAAMTATESH